MRFAKCGRFTNRTYIVVVGFGSRVGGWVGDGPFDGAQDRRGLGAFAESTIREDLVGGYLVVGGGVVVALGDFE